MLQKNTGILFRNGIDRENPIHSVLYSNVGTMSNEIKTMAGDLYLMANQDFPSALAYNFVQRIEKSSPDEKESPRIDELLEEFSVLATFGLHAIFSPVREVVRILTDKQVQSYRSQDEVVRRIFDNHIILGEAEIHDFVQLVDDFLMLERIDYEIAKKAINRYVIAIRNIPENPTMAYTVLVSAIDILIPEKSSAHGNFIRYLENHIDFEDLASELPMSDFPIKEKILNILSHNAYTIRSDFIHGPKLLPEKLSGPSNFSEYLAIGDDFYLTLQGLIRIVKQLITNFIKKGNKINIEKYKIMQTGQSKSDKDVIILPTVNLEPKKYVYRHQFNSMLEHYRKYLLGLEETVGTDIRPQLYEIESTIDAATDNNKVTMFAIHTCYNAIVDEEGKSKGHMEFFEKFKHLMAKSFPEILILRTIIGNHDWTLATHQTAIDRYWKKRFKEDRIVGGPIFESAFYLDLAERHRNETNGEKSAKDKVEKLIRRAVREYPNHPKLRQFEKEYDGIKPINWMEILGVRDTEGEAENKSVE